jgi:hypothetical protein
MLLQKPISRHFPSESTGSNLPGWHDKQPTKGPRFKAQVLAGYHPRWFWELSHSSLQGQHGASLPNVWLVVLNIR